MEHAADVSLSAGSVDGARLWFMTRATEYITSNMSEVIRTFKHSVMKGSLQVFLPPTHSVSFAFELCGASKVVRRFTTHVKKKKKKKKSRAGA